MSEIYIKYHPPCLSPQFKCLILNLCDPQASLKLKGASCTTAEENYVK